MQCMPARRPSRHFVLMLVVALVVFPLQRCLLLLSAFSSISSCACFALVVFSLNVVCFCYRPRRLFLLVLVVALVVFPLTVVHFFSCRRCCLFRLVVCFLSPLLFSPSSFSRPSTAASESECRSAGRALLAKWASPLDWSCSERWWGSTTFSLTSFQW